eukprot:384022_1
MMNTLFIMNLFNVIINARIISEFRYYFNMKDKSKLENKENLDRSITQQPQLSLCFLLITKDDSIKEIYGGSVAKHCVRGMGSYIKDDSIKEIYGGSVAKHCVRGMGSYIKDD